MLDAASRAVTRLWAPSLGLALLAASVLALACGSAPSYSSAAGAGAQFPQASSAASGAPLRDWPEFGLDARRTSASNASTGITAANVARLRRRVVSLPGTVDSSPIYLHGVTVGGATHDVVVATTTYGRTLAVDVHSGKILWTFTPPGFDGWSGSSQITNSAPLADPDRHSVYATSPDGHIHKLSLADGSEAGGWPVSVTRNAVREKLGSSLNIDGRYLVVVTGGYFGDAQPYQGHVVLIDRASGAVSAVFNTLCDDRRAIIAPSSCSASDSAIWSRAGAVVEPNGRLLVATGNGPYNGTTNFGDSVLELDFPSLSLRQAFTPRNQASLSSSDTDLGSSSPALLGSGVVEIAGKDGVVRLMHLGSLDGHQPSPHNTPGGEIQTLRTPGGDQMLAQPAVWRHGTRTAVFMADGSGTTAFAVVSGRLRQVWANNLSGSSPVLAGGLLYVYDPNNGGVRVYRPSSPRPLATLPCGSGHWNSPIVADGHVVVPEGDANAHSLSGRLDIFSLG